MAEQRASILVGVGTPEVNNLPKRSYQEYVNSLTAGLRLTKPPEELYEKSAMELESWLASIELSPDAHPVSASLTVGPGTLYKKGTRQIELDSTDPIPKDLKEVRLHGAHRLGWYALAEAKLQFLEKNYEDLPALRGFNLEARRHDIRSQAKSFIRNGSWPKDYDPIRRRFLKTAVATGFTLVLAACGVQAPLPAGGAETAIPPGMTETANIPLSRDIIINSVNLWQTFNDGAVNISITGEFAPYPDPIDPSRLSPYLMKPEFDDGTRYAMSPVPITAEGPTASKDYVMPVLTRLNADGTVESFGLFDVTDPKAPNVEVFLVEARGQDGSLVQQDWMYKITHLSNGLYGYSIVNKDGSETFLKYAGLQQQDTIDGNVYNVVFHPQGVEVVPTLTPAAPEGVVLSEVEINEIVMSVNSQLSSGYTLKANSENAFVITSPDGQVVKNLLLRVDGKFYLTESDGTTKVYPPEIVFMPSPDTIYMGLDQINPKSGDVSEIPFNQTKWPKDPEKQSPRITSEMLPQYEKWIRNQLEDNGNLNQAFEGADTAIKWQVVNQGFVIEMDINGDNTIDKSNAPVLYPVEDPKSLRRASIPIRSFGSFVTVVDLLVVDPLLQEKQYISVFPVVIKNSDPNQETYSLFPALTDTDRINSKDTSVNHALRNLVEPEKGTDTIMNGVAVEPVVFVGPYLNLPSNVDNPGSKLVVPHFLIGTNPDEGTARMKILQDGIQSGFFKGSEAHFWVITSYDFAKR